MFNLKKKHRFLIIARVGDSSLHQGWLEPKEYINYDLCISYYGDIPDRFKEESDFYFASKGPKWSEIKEIIIALGEQIFQYDAVWIPDDDLEVNAYTIHKMFNTFIEQKIDLGQPALTKDSFYSHPITIQKSDYLLRYSPFVEIMAPIFSRESLRICYPTFNINQSGWGIDLLWPTLLKNSNRKIAIIDDTPVKHTRPVRTGPLYSMISMSPVNELAEMEKKYHVNRSTYSQLHSAGILKDKKVFLLILAHQNEDVLAEQIKNIRHYNPNSGIILYNGGTNQDFAQNLDVVICPYSHPVKWGNSVRVFWDVMKWLEEMQVDYEYLMNLDHDMLFIKEGFEEFLKSTLDQHDCMGWCLLDGKDSSNFPDPKVADSLWKEWHLWQPLFKTDTFFRYFNPGQIYRRRIIKQMLKSLAHVEQNNLEKLFENTNVFAPEETFWVTLAMACGGKCREYPDGNQYNNAVRWGEDITIDEVKQIINHPSYFWIHPVKGNNLILLNRWLFPPFETKGLGENILLKEKKKKKLRKLKNKNSKSKTKNFKLKPKKNVKNAKKQNLLRKSKSKKNP